MLADDRPDFPATMFCRLKFEGALAEKDFEAAVRAALDRHPLLAAAIQPSGRQRPAWSAPPAGRMAVDWADCTTPLSFPRRRRIDLTGETGVRLWGRRGDATTEIWLQVHHACCDGLGVLQFLADILVLYHNGRSSTGAPLELPVLDPSLLKHRDEFPARKRRPHNLRTLREACGAAGFLLRKPLALQVPPESGPAAGGCSYPVFQAGRLTPEASGRLAESAAQSGATLNALLLCRLFRTLQDWTLQDAADQRSRYLRVAMPFNMRGPAHQQMPAANLVSLAFLDRKSVPELSDEELLQSISRRTAGVKRRRWGSFLRILGLLDRAGLLPRVLASRRAQVTALFSNLGDVWRNVPLPREGSRIVAGDAVLDEVDLLAPIRPGMVAAFVVFSYADRLNVCMSYDARGLPRERAAALLANFLERLQQ